MAYGWGTRAGRDTTTCTRSTETPLLMGPWSRCTMRWHPATVWGSTASRSSRLPPSLPSSASARAPSSSTIQRSSSLSSLGRCGRPPGSSRQPTRPPALISSCKERVWVLCLVADFLNFVVLSIAICQFICVLVCTWELFIWDADVDTRIHFRLLYGGRNDWFYFLPSFISLFTSSWVILFVAVLSLLKEGQEDWCAIHATFSLNHRMNIYIYPSMYSHPLYKMLYVVLKSIFYYLSRYEIEWILMVWWKTHVNKLRY